MVKVRQHFYRMKGEQGQVRWERWGDGVEREEDHFSSGTSFAAAVQFAALPAKGKEKGQDVCRE